MGFGVTSQTRHAQGIKRTGAFSNRTNFGGDPYSAKILLVILRNFPQKIEYCLGWCYRMTCVKSQNEVIPVLGPGKKLWRKIS